MDAGPDAVKRQLADTDRHAANTLVADAENCFIVRDNHEFDVAERRRVAQNLLDAAGIVGRNENAARPPIHVRKEMRGRANGRRVNHRHQFFQVVTQHSVEQNLVAILQQAEIDIPADRVLVEADRVVGAVGLHLDIVVLRRQHAFDAELAALLRRETDTLVVDGGTQ
jgi:hypothetical protein